MWEVATKDPDRRRPLREAAAAGRRATPEIGARVLVVANRTLEGEELRAELRHRAAAGAELRIVAPILASRVHYIASDVDNELGEARERLAAALAWAEAAGIDGERKVGDPNVALGAIEDELRRLRRRRGDHLHVSRRGRSNWLETGIVERLRDELDIPVPHVVVQPEHAPLAAPR